MKKKYDKEIVAEAAKKCSSKKEFLTNYSGHYAFAKRTKILEEICSHMPKHLNIDKKPHNQKWDEDTIASEALLYKTKQEFRDQSHGAYKAAIRLAIIDKVCAHMKVVYRNWDRASLKEEALKYNTRADFINSNMSAYSTALKMPNNEEFFAHMETLWEKKWDIEEAIFAEAKKYESRSEFMQKSNGAYVAARKKDIIEQATAHMGSPINESWSNEELQIEAKKYNTKTEFYAGSLGAYAAAHKRGILDEICAHMKMNNSWDFEKIKEVANQYETRVDFQRENSAGYTAAHKRNLLDEVCAHMRKSQNISRAEQILSNFVKERFPKAQTLRDRNVKIEGKPHIKGFDIDIYIPELRKGIEFDGKYWHSFTGLKKGRTDWPEEDVFHYHDLKDTYFLSKGIEILHIKEIDWNQNKEECIQKVFAFLGV